MFNLSVVNIVPNTHKDAINQIAELYGCGPNNLSVKLKNSAGKVFWGCHSWWKPEDYAIFSDDELRQQVVPTELQPSLEFLYERLMLDGDAQENWQAALALNGLSEIREENQT